MENLESEIESGTDVELSIGKLMTNFIKLIPKMRKMRKRVKKILPNLEDTAEAIKAPSSQEIQSDLEKICSVPHRRIGSNEAKKIEDFLYNVFIEHGLVEVKKDPFGVLNWQAKKWKFSLEIENQIIEIPAFYMLHTGFTGSKGITAPLVYVGKGKERDFKRVDVKNKIVVAEVIMPTTPAGLMKRVGRPYYISDPKKNLKLRTTMKLTFVPMNVPPYYHWGWKKEDGVYTRAVEKKRKKEHSLYWRAVNNGALGVVLILKDYISNVNTHWGPYDAIMKPIPGLFVGRYDGKKLRELIKNGEAKGTLLLEGIKEAATAHNILGILPGKSDEMIMISSHHDAAFEGASEDGTGVAMVLAQLKAWSRIPESERPRSLLFVISAGHLYGGLGAELFAEAYKDTLLKKVLIDINLEHLCAKDVDEDPVTHSYRLTDNLAMGLLFISPSEYIVANTVKSLKKHNIEKLAVIPENYFATPPIGEAAHFLKNSQFKILHWIRSPYYLLNSEDTLDKIDMDKLGPTAQCAMDIVDSLMHLPKDKF